MSSLPSRFVVRASGLRPAARRQAQLIRPQPGNAVRQSSGHGHGNEPWGANGEHLPFSIKDSNTRMAIKCAIFMGTGFGIPFVAIWWHWNRPGGLNNA